MARLVSQRSARLGALAVCLAGAVGCGTLRQLVTIQVPVPYALPCPSVAVPERPAMPAPAPVESAAQTAARLNVEVATLLARVEMLEQLLTSQGQAAAQLRQAFEAALKAPAPK